MTPRPLITAALSAALGALIAVGALSLGGAFDNDSTTTTVAPSGGNDSSAAAANVPARPASVTDIYDRVGQGVVFVEARQAAGRATGSGFLIDDQGNILTNQHVVNGAREVRVRFGEDGDRIEAKLVGEDPNSDVALLKIDANEAKKHRPLELGDSSDVKVGESTIAIGSPFGLAGSVTTGIVSALDREIESPNGFSIDGVIQTDAAINPGNSGGPLLDSAGRVIGINSQIATDGNNANSGVGFAVPIDTAQMVAKDLESDGKVERAYLGISSAEVDGEVARELNLPQSDGALVQEVVPNGPADDAGIRGGRGQATDLGVLRGGDLIVKVGDTAVKKPEDVANAIETLKPGDEVELELYRGDAKRTITVKLGERPDQPRTP